MHTVTPDLGRVDLEIFVKSSRQLCLGPYTRHPYCRFGKQAVAKRPSYTTALKGFHTSQIWLAFVCEQKYPCIGLSLDRITEPEGITCLPEGDCFSSWALINVRERFEVSKLDNLNDLRLSQELKELEIHPAVGDGMESMDNVIGTVGLWEQSKGALHIFELFLALKIRFDR